MAPVATAPNETFNGNGKISKPLLFNPVIPYYKDAGLGDSDYKFAHYKVSFILVLMPTLLTFTQPVFPDVHWEPLAEIAVSDRGLLADPSKKSLLSAATKVTDLTPGIGTELLGVDLRQLSDSQKDELYVFVIYECVPHFSHFRQ